MRLHAVSLAAIAAALLAASSMLVAAAPSDRGSESRGSVVLTQAKKPPKPTAKAKVAKKAVVKKAGKKGPAAKAKHAAGKSCGTFMYYSPKQRKCLDARAKK